MGQVIEDVFPTEIFEFYCPDCRHEWKNSHPAGMNKMNYTCPKCRREHNDIGVIREEPDGAA